MDITALELFGCIIGLVAFIAFGIWVYWQIVKPNPSMKEFYQEAPQ